METASVSPRPRGTSRPETPRGHTPAGAEPSPPVRAPTLLADGSPDGDGRRRGLGGGGPGVKKHHHKHNLKHRYELLETLGRGTYGKVKKAIERHSGREVSRHVTVKTPAPTTPAVPPTCALVCFSPDQTELLVLIATFPRPQSLACCQRVHRGQGVLAPMLPRPLPRGCRLTNVTLASWLPPEI